MLLDTSGLLCYHHRDEPQHLDAVGFVDASPRLVTHSYILSEFIPLCHVRGLPRVEALEFVSDLIDDPRIDLVWVDESLHRFALSLLQSRLDKSYSHCDAVSFVLMRLEGITEALTTDRHFEQEGFVRLLTP